MLDPLQTNADGYTLPGPNAAGRVYPSLSQGPLSIWIFGTLFKGTFALL